MDLPVTEFNYLQYATNSSTATKFIVLLVGDESTETYKEAKERNDIKLANYECVVKVIPCYRVNKG